MKLIEKKCPNCGANLEFKDSDKSCKCSHCGSSFEIERDKDKSDLSDQFDLKPLKAFSIFSAFTFAEIFIIFIIVFVIIIALFFQVFNFKSSSEKELETKYENDIISDLFKEKSYVESVDKLSNSDISSINHKSEMKISYRGEGANDVDHSYNRSGKPRREKIYVAYKKDGNYIITIYKAVYHDFFHQESSYTVYVPIVFENVKEDVSFSLGDGEVSAPEYYFNSEKTSYTYGYASFEEAYNNVVKPLEKDYTITEK